MNTFIRKAYILILDISPMNNCIISLNTCQIVSDNLFVFVQKINNIAILPKQKSVLQQLVIFMFYQSNLSSDRNAY